MPPTETARGMIVGDIKEVSAGDVAGVVKAILVLPGHSVDTGQPLFTVQREDGTIVTVESSCSGVVTNLGNRYGKTNLTDPCQAVVTIDVGSDALMRLQHEEDERRQKQQAIADGREPMPLLPPDYSGDSASGTTGHNNDFPLP